jgi:Secretion system C-terminal sorting domain
MKNILVLIATILFSLQIFAQAPVKSISGNLYGNLNWSVDTVYFLKGKVYVKAGATLNIAPGTIIKGDTASALIVVRGGRINAIGTPSKPIVFTSAAPVGSRKAGDWGGLVISGNAKNNISGGIGKLEGGNLSNPDGTLSDGFHGGLNDLDNSGTLKYVRIEFAGYSFQQNNELNSLTLGSVGLGTTLDYVQCSYGFDDAFEFFGGNVNAKHLVSFRSSDDDFDTDFGFRGNVQFAISLRDTAFADSVSGANAFESDNNETGSANAPFTTPNFSNVTIVGPLQTSSTTFNPNFKSGVHIRRNSKLGLFNSIIMGFPTGLKLDGDSCHRNADSNFLAVRNTAIFGCPNSLDSATGVPWDITTWFNTLTFFNINYSSNADALLANPFSYSMPNFMPTNSSPMLAGASFADSRVNKPFFDFVAYRGALGSVDWTANWTEWDPQNEPYQYGYGVNPQSLTGQEFKCPINIFPNPSKGQVIISFQTLNFEDVQISLINLNGSVVNTIKNFAINHEIQMNTSNLPSGIYYIKVISKLGTQFVKMQIR